MPQKNVHLYYTVPVAMVQGLPFRARTDTGLPNGAVFENAAIGAVGGNWSEQVAVQLDSANANTIVVAIRNINGTPIGPDPNVDITITVVVTYS